MSRPIRLHLGVCGLAAIWCIAPVALLHAQAPPTGQEQIWQWPAPVVDRALSYIRLVPSDMNLRDDYVSRDGCRLKVVDRLMRDPVSGPDFLQRASARVFGKPVIEHFPDSEEEMEAVWRLMRVLPGADRPPSTPGAHDATYVYPDLGLTSDWQRLLGTALAACADARWDDSLLGDLDRERRFLLTEQMPLLVLEDEADKDRSEPELDSIQAVEDSLALRFAAFSDSVDWGWLRARGTSAVERILAAIPREAPFSAQTGESGNTIQEWQSPVGRVLIGTMGSDVFTGSAVVIIDPGGDDNYRLQPQLQGQPRLIIDWDGDDSYFAPEGYDLGTGRWSWGCLYDRAGDDSYRAGDFALGAGWFGVGVLIDAEGEDLYALDTYGLGAGGFGIGILYDGGRQADQYTGRLFAQGFGYAAGIGLLADAGGNDTYVAGGLYEDILRYRDHYTSLSQGFAYGIRPHFSGGVGLLLDAWGNDVYVADIFGQGASYWWAFGGLYDGAGNDQYVAYQYAQGSATHLTAGCLFDAGGDDTYSSKGVSQGCGHDWAAGLLVDVSGNDRYTATDLSQAAGSANGVGILIDAAGDDAYSVVSRANTQGYGNPRREYGSIGLFLDGAGTDRYDGPGRDSSIWLGNSSWGVGVDADSIWNATLLRGADAPR